MQDIREIEFKNSGSTANNKMCFKVQATTLRPHLHTDTSTQDLPQREPPPRNLQLQS